MKHNPVYNLRKLEDCVRLVQSTRPRKDFAAAMLEVIDRTPCAPSKAEVLAEMKRLKEQQKAEDKAVEEWKGQNL